MEEVSVQGTDIRAPAHFQLASLLWGPGKQGVIWCPHRHKARNLTKAHR